MSNEEAEDVEIEPRHRRRNDHRRQRDHRKGSMTAAAIKASEAPVTVVLARLSMIATPFLFAALSWFVVDAYSDMKVSMKEYGDGLQQVLINQAVGIAERDDQKRRLGKIEEGMTRLWQQLMSRGKDN